MRRTAIATLGLGLGLGALVLATGAHAATSGKTLPDLEGVWTTASYTQLQRPKALKSLVVTPEEADAYEAAMSATHGIVPLGKDQVGQLDSEFSDSGDHPARINGQIRSSWIVSPADGRLPFTPEARARWTARGGFDNPEDRSAAERCLTAGGSSPPQLSTMDANLLQIVQTRTTVAVASEKNHDLRLIALDRPRDPRQPPSWSGDSVGRWEGRTLVVETQGFRDPWIDRLFLLHSNKARVTERFTRLSRDELLYAFSLEDPVAFTEPVKGEMLFRRTDGRLYEFACHEGNSSLTHVLAAARVGRQDEPKPPAPAPAPPPVISGP